MLLTERSDFIEVEIKFQHKHSKTMFHSFPLILNFYFSIITATRPRPRHHRIKGIVKNEQLTAKMKDKHNVLNSSIQGGEFSATTILLITMHSQ